MSEGLLLFILGLGSRDLEGELGISVEIFEVRGVSGISPDEGRVDGGDCEVEDEGEWE